MSDEKTVLQLWYEGSEAYRSAYNRMGRRLVGEEKGRVYIHYDRMSYWSYPPRKNLQQKRFRKKANIWRMMLNERR